MLEQAKSKLDDREQYSINKNTNILLTNMDCEEIKENFPSDYFDTIVDINNFQSYNDYQKVYEGVKHILKDKGIFLFMAKGESSFFFIRDFYKIFKPFTFMKQAQDLTINWQDVIENDKDWEILYKERKNYGRTYLYILRLNKN